jgi:hypothetical protein
VGGSTQRLALGSGFCPFAICLTGSMDHTTAVANGVAGCTVGDMHAGVGGSLQKWRQGAERE